jgi:hypothetical protein
MARLDGARHRHRERSDAIQGNAGRLTIPGLLRRFAPRNDDPVKTQTTPATKIESAAGSR